MLLPRPLYHALPFIYVTVGGLCLCIALGFNAPAGLTRVEIILLSGAGGVLLGFGIAVFCMRLRYRQNRTVFVKQAVADQDETDDTNRLITVERPGETSPNI